MTADSSIEDAVSQLEMLGIDRKKAIKALNRYNNNVERAADYIFSGNAESDSDDANEYPWANINSFENVYSSDQEQQQQQQQNISLDTIDNDLNSAFGEERRANLTKDYEKTRSQSNNQAISHSSASWSIVPYVEKSTNEENEQEQENDDHNQGLTKANLTWWVDPENPSERAAAHNNPIGLRPPSYNFAYSPVIIQTLFHVSLFRFAILSFRPLPYNWGATRNYWKGFGESVSGYIVRDVKMDELTTQMTNSIIDDDDDDDGDDDDDDDDALQNNNMNQMDIDQQQPISSETSNQNNLMESENHQQQKIANYSNHNETEVITMTKDHLVLAELQKLFTFLSCSQRMYGSVSHLIRVFNSDVTNSSNSWKMEDKNVDEFLDMFFRQLIATDQVNEFIKNNEEFKGLLSFHDLFRLQAEVCSGDDVDIEEVYYLNLIIDATAKTFYDCLDPLVYESYLDDSTFLDSPDDEIISNPSDDGVYQELPYKITTFTQVPPLLFITLEDRREYKTKNNVNNNHKKTYTVEKTIYLDRYLNVNKSISLQKYQQSDELRKQIQKTQYELQKIQNNNHDFDKHQLLDSTITYFNNKMETVENIPENNGYMESLKSLQSILHQVHSNIEKKQSELKQLKNEQSQKLQEIFNDANLQKKPFDLRAVLYTDGHSGTGHYWGYIWVEPNERNLLIDIEVDDDDGGWYRFCDADVQRVTEDDIWKEDINPFALLYVDRSIPCLTKEELDKYIPEELKNIIYHDNEIFLKEIQDYKCNTNRDKTINHAPFASSYLSNRKLGGSSTSEQGFNEKHGEIYKNGSYEKLNDSVFDEQIIEEEVVYDDFKSPKEMNNNNEEEEEDYDDDDDEDAKYSNESLSIDDQSMDVTVYDTIALDVAAEKIIEARNITNNGSMFLERFDMFLAVAKDVHTLSNYIKIVDTQIQSIPPNNNVTVDVHNVNDISNLDRLNIKLASITISEIRQIIKDDRQLCELLELYLQYLSMGEIITNALLLFNKDNYIDAIEQILTLKQLNETWRTELLLNDSLMTKYPGLDSVGFNRIATSLGKAIIKILNMQAYKKACHESYQEKGLEDGIKVANQAFQVIGNEVGDERTQYFTELSENWLNFAEQQHNGRLDERPADLLNTLVMIYFDGPSTRMNATNNNPFTTDRYHSKIDEDENQSNLCHQFLVNLQHAENKLNL